MNLFKALILVTFVLGLSACGIKPKRLDPPETTAKTAPVFPRTYPDPAL